MSSSIRLHIIAGIRIPSERLDANDGHVRTIAEVVPLCVRGHNASSPFCPKCGAPVSDVSRTREEVYTLRERLLALPDVDGDEECLRGGCVTVWGGYLWGLGQERRRPEYVVGVPIRFESRDYELRTTTLDAPQVSEAIDRARALCASVALDGEVTVHVAAWISY